MVELTGVTKTYGDVRAVDGVNLVAREGEFLTFLGPSGCGKTTTLRMIAGFEQPTAGHIRIDGRPVDGMPPFQRDVNTVFQNYALFPHMTVAQNVAFGLHMKKVPKSEIQTRVTRALEMVQLTGLANRKPRQLSGGQQQRVAVARALVNNPRVLLLDEPLGALDLKLRKEMQVELKHLQQRLGMTFIYVTHDQEEALVMSDRIAVMHQGKVAQLGSPADIYERPATRFVAGFIGEANLLDGVVADGGLVQVGPLHIAVDSKALPGAGTKVTLSVRPEKVTLAPAEGSNAFEGRLEELIYVGAHVKAVVALEPGQRVVAALPAAPGSIRPGDRLRIGWDPAHTAIMTA
jgi:spermidine/putrescine transport system ATP-binding protein